MKIVAFKLKYIFKTLHVLNERNVTPPPPPPNNVCSSIVYHRNIFKPPKRQLMVHYLL
jgi:hypothetical protein